MQLQDFLFKLDTSPELVNFAHTMQVIDALYEYHPTGFSNGELLNNVGENQGSCKIFYFAKLHNLNEEQTLACFGEYYRNDVLSQPDEKNHQNIRNFMQTGWPGINFQAEALMKK